MLLKCIIKSLISDLRTVFGIRCIIDMNVLVICVEPKKGGIRLDIVGLVLIIAGSIFFGYSILSKNKVNIYNRRKNLVVVNMRQFLKVQLYCSIITSVCIIAWGLVIIIYNLPEVYVMLSPLLFPFLNALINPISRMSGYIE